MLDINKTVEYWRAGADRAIEIADVLLEKDKYPEALFFGHLALEKILKALVTKVTGTHPPYTHDLEVLAKLAAVTLTTEQNQLLEEVTDFNLEGRYPEDIQALRQRLSGGAAHDYLTRVQTLLSWLHSRLQS